MFNSIMNSFNKSLVNLYASRGYSPIEKFSDAGKYIERVETKEGPLLVKASFPGRPGRFFRIIRDWDALEKLQGIPGVPRAVGLFQYIGGSWKSGRPAQEEVNAARRAVQHWFKKGMWFLTKNTGMLLVRQFVKGQLENAQQLSASEFEQLEETVSRIHSRNIARLDIHSKNIVLAERPYLFDFDMVTTPDEASFEEDRKRDIRVLKELRKRRSVEFAKPRAV
jgi:hypothetical protein